MNLFKNAFTLIICISLFWQVKGQTNKHQNIPNAKVNVLFIGNSLTYTNNLPLLVKKYAKQNNLLINTKMVAHPNYALSDHWADGKVKKLIVSKKYHFVIIQQGPSSQQNGRQMLIDYGGKYSALCKNNNAKLVYFMVWPPLSHPERFEGVLNNYRHAATINGAILCPVGEVWKTHLETTNNFDYYGADGFHPSKKGSNVAAKVIAKSLLQNI